MTPLLLELEAEARQRAHTLEVEGKLPAGYTDQHYPLNPAEQAELRRLKHALAAATDAGTYVALARGRSVDSSRLNPRMAAYWQRYG